MISPLEKSIIRTVCYADVFDYPLRIEEIWKRLIGLKVKHQALSRQLKKMNMIDEKENYYFLKGRKEIIDIRNRRKKYSSEKYTISQKVVNLLKIIPTIKMVAITGTLAVWNADRNDDIDLLIVTEGDLLWTTRLLTTAVVELMGIRRRPGEDNVENKICLNMYVDENNLKLPPGSQGLFTAYEIMQMKPLFDRDETYGKFLAKNNWVRKYLPNTICADEKRKAKSAKIKRGREVFESMLLKIIELYLKRFQLWFMREKVTTEIISDGIIRFHPKDAREWIMRKYHYRLSKMNFTHI